MIELSRIGQRDAQNAERYSEIDLAHVEAFIENESEEIKRNLDQRILDRQWDTGIMYGLAAAITIIEQLRLNRRLADR